MLPLVITSTDSNIGLELDGVDQHQSQRHMLDLQEIAWIEAHLQSTSEANLKLDMFDVALSMMGQDWRNRRCRRGTSRQTILGLTNLYFELILRLSNVSNETAGNIHISCLSSLAFCWLQLSDHDSPMLITTLYYRCHLDAITKVNDSP